MGISSEGGGLDNQVKFSEKLGMPESKNKNTNVQYLYRG